MHQVARNPTNADDGFPRGMDYLILERDPLYRAAFRDRSTTGRPHKPSADVSHPTATDSGITIARGRRRP
jgi:hypothetical protein